jgi:putative hemolysin
MGLLWELVIIVALVLLNGFFSGSEIALLSVRKTRLAELARNGKSTAALALKLREHPERLLATVQVGITVVGAAAAAFGGSALEGPLSAQFEQWGFGEYSHGAALVLVVGAISALSIVLGELVPKSLALRSSENVSLAVAAPLTVVGYITQPIGWLLTSISNLILWPFRDQTNFSETRLSADELQQLVEEASSSGAVHERAGDIASRAIDLDSLRVSSILVPRQQVVMLPRDAKLVEIKRVLESDLYSRYPVTGKDNEDIIGYVLARDLFQQLVKTGQVNLTALLRPAHFIVESRRAVDALHEMQRRRTPLAMVVDEHGGFQGVISASDITEELVGDILGEHDSEELRIEPEGDRAYLVVGTTTIHELNRELGCELPVGPGFTTIAGLVIHTAGRMVTSGETVMLPGNIEAEVLDANPRQVRSVRLTLPIEATDA